MTPELSGLPAISPSTALLLNRMTASKWLVPPQQEAEENIPALAVYFVQPSTTREVQVEIEITADFGKVLLYAGMGLIDFLSDHIVPGWREEDADSLPVDWRAVLALEAYLPVTWLGKILLVRARPGAMRAGGRGALLETLHGQVEADGGSFDISLDLSGLELRALDVLPDLPDEAQTGFDPGFCCRSFLPGRSLLSTAYGALEQGDAVLIGKLQGGRLPILIEIPETEHFSAGLDLRTGIAELFEQTGYLRMTDTEALPDVNGGMIYGEPPLADPAGDLPVRLDFLLSTRRLTLSELRALGPGATLDVNIDLTQPLTILANGAPAGRGYLVQIGDQVAVQLSQWGAGTRQADG